MRPSLLALPALVLALSAPAAAASKPQTFLDSTGENPQAPDITSIVVSNDDAGLITFKVNISNRPSLTPDMEIDLFLDTDTNPATGDPDAHGAEYVIQLVQDSADLYAWNGSDYKGAASQSSLVYSYDPSGATIKVKASELGGTHAFDFVALAGSGITIDANGNPDYDNAAIDVAPDVGHGTFAYQVRMTLRLSVTNFQASTTDGTVSASLAATENDTGAPFTDGSVSCRASVGGKALAASAHAVTNGVATCVWRVPKSAHGKRLTGIVTVTVRGATAAKSFSVKIR
jgi:hypothetical protein